MLTSMNELFEIAEKKSCAIPAFNIYNSETALGIFQAAEEANACIIVQMYSRLFMSEEAKFIAPAIVAAAHRAKVKVAFHLDHGSCDEAVFRAIKYGCSSVMRDASTLPLDENIAIIKNIVHFAHDLGLSVEAELGHIGSAKDGVSAEYTKVDEAVRFCAETDVDALAVAVGTAHGHYKQAPVLAIERIRKLNSAIPAALVLHGGSGVPDDQINAAIRAGIRKVNFGTDVCLAFLNGVREADSSIIGVDTFMKEPVQRVKRFALEKIRLLGAEDSDV
jgi:fructose-bisphosphate aldolase class II